MVNVQFNVNVVGRPPTAHHAPEAVAPQDLHAELPAWRPLQCDVRQVLRGGEPRRVLDAFTDPDDLGQPGVSNPHFDQCVAAEPEEYRELDRSVHRDPSIPGAGSDLRSEPSGTDPTWTLA